MTKPFKIYSASAGSGKTYTLALSYLRVALASPDQDPDEPYNPRYFRYILAVTFTKAAAAEMKERIINYLYLVAETDISQPSAFFNQLLKNINTEYAEKGILLNAKELIHRAQLAFSHLLHHYTDFNVKTLDSFIQSLAQAFAHELDLPMGFQVELEKDETYTEAIYRLLLKVGVKGDPRLSMIFREFALGTFEDKFNKKVAKDLVQFAEKTDSPIFAARIKQWQRYSQAEQDHIKKYYIESLRYVRREAPKKLRKLAQDAINIIEKEGFSEENFKQYSAWSYFKKIACGDYKNSMDILENNYSNYVQKLINEADPSLKDGGKNKKSKDALSAVSEKLGLVLQQIAVKIEMLRTQFRLELNIADNICKVVYPLMLVSEVKIMTESLQHEQGTAFLDQVTQRINGIVLSDPMPYIYERLGEKYKHIFIDEFQDTSEVQFTNMLPLLGHALSLERDSLVVGDTKQAIYRWRGGNTELLADIHQPYQLELVQQNELLQEHAIPLALTAQKASLDTNYRSLDNIIGFNNAIFGFLMNLISNTEADPKAAEAFKNDLIGLQKYYTDVFQKSSRGAGGQVVLAFHKKQNTSKTELYNSVSTNEEQNEPNEDEQNAKRVLSNAKSEWALEQCLLAIQEAKADGYTEREMAVLVRTNKEAVNTAFALVNAEIPIISAEALLLINAPVVEALINFFKLLKYPHQANIKMDLLLFFYAHQQGKDHTERFPKAADFNEFAEESRKEDIVAFFNYIFSRFGLLFDYRACLYLTLYEVAEEFARCLELGKRADLQIYWQAILDIVLAEGRKRHNNVSDFIDFWEKKKFKLAVAAPEGTNAIQIVTIHKAKGLQYPIVILPFATWPTKSTNNPLWRDVPHEVDAPEPLEFIIFKPKEDVEGTALEPYYLEEKASTFLESMNILYVALTRAEERLYIFSSLVKTDPLKGGLNTISKLFQVFSGHLHLQKSKEKAVDSEDTAETKPEGDEWNYIYGKVPRHTQPKAYTEAQHSLAHFYSTKTAQQLQLYFSNLKPESVNLESADLLSEERMAILAALVAKKVEHLPKLKAQLSSLVDDGLILLSESQQVEQMLLQKIKTDNLQNLFSSQSKRGQELALQNGSVVRIDRIWFSAKQIEALLIYKGQPEVWQTSLHEAIRKALQKIYQQETIIRVLFL